MSAPKPDAAAKGGAETDKEKAEGAPSGKGGIGAWLPLLLTLVMMPVLAYATTTFLILPKLKKSAGSGEDSAHDSAPAKSDHGSAKDAGGHGGGGDKGGDKGSGGHGTAKKNGGDAGKARQAFPFSKLVVNVAGTMGTRYLVVNFTLVGTSATFKEEMTEHKDQLTDLALSTLSSKTIVDMERPEAKNQLRSELITAFNGALGGDRIHELFFTEFAMQ